MIRFLVSLFLVLVASSVSAQDIRQSAAGLLFGPPATGPATPVPGSTVQLQTLNGTAGNQLIINNNAAAMPWTSNSGFAGQDAGLQIWALDAHNAILGLTSFPGGTSPSSEIYMRGIGGTGAAPLATPTGYTLGSLIFQGWTGTLMRTGTSILGVAMDNFSGSSYGSRLSFFTVPVGSTTNNENMRIWPDGAISVGSANTGTDPGSSGILSATSFQVGTNAAAVRITTQYFTASANGTYTPNANLVFAMVECVGQGGGGGGAAASGTGVSSGGGGGGGSYARVRLTAAQIGASQAVTNTASANGGSTGNNAGGGGADTSLGSLCVGKGGGGGGGAAANSDGTAGAGGVAGTGDFTTVGNAGGRGEGASITTAPTAAGMGAGGPWGGAPAAIQGSASAVNGNAGGGCGAGGGGGSVVGSASTAAGGQGGTGCILITEYNSQ